MRGSRTYRMSLVLAILLLSAFFITACSAGGLKTKDGEEIPAEVTVELGDIYMLADVDGGEEAVTAVVRNTAGEEIRVNNNKFRVDDLGGYVITYTAGEQTATTKVNVKDTSSPVISLGVPEGMVVIFGNTFIIPECMVSDVSGETIEATVSVTDPDGNSVTVTDNGFTADKLGNYSIKYEARDSSGNVGTKVLNVSSENADLLNDFETESCVGYLAYNAVKEVVTENVSTGNGIKLTADDDSAIPYRRICLPLRKNGEYISWDDLQRYEKVQIYL